MNEHLLNQFSREVNVNKGNGVIKDRATAIDPKSQAHAVEKRSELSLHDDIKYRIEKACIELGFNAKSEYSGKDWRADVFAAKDALRYAFEVQTSPQSLKQTVQRQNKY